MTEAKVTQNQKHLEKQVSNPEDTDILVSLAAQDDINYLKNAGSSAVIDLAEFEEKGNTRDSIRDLSLKNTSGLAYSVSDLLEWAKRLRRQTIMKVFMTKIHRS